jgi:hypothetical protein
VLLEFRTSAKRWRILTMSAFQAHRPCPALARRVTVECTEPWREYTKARLQRKPAGRAGVCAVSTVAGERLRTRRAMCAGLP